MSLKNHRPEMSSGPDGQICLQSTVPQKLFILKNPLNVRNLQLSHASLQVSTCRGQSSIRSKKQASRPFLYPQNLSIMKKILFSFFFVLLTSSLVAQDPGYNGPAKVPLKTFWSHIEKLKTGKGLSSSVNNAERMLQQIKERDPSYNTAPLEAEVKIWKDKAEKEAAEKNAAKEKSDSEKNYFQKIWQKMTGVYSTGSIIEPGMSGKEYYDRVVALDLPTFKEKRAAAGQVDPKSFAALTDEMLADYNNYLKRSDRLKWRVVRPMSESNNIRNSQEKLKALEDIKYECEAVLMLSPDHPEFKQKLAEVKKLLGNAGNEAAKFYTSEFHKENVNKIVWSTQPLEIGKEKEMSGLIKTSFKTGDAIFGTLYLGNTVKLLMSGNEKLRIIIRIDGGTAVWGGDLSYIIVPLNSQEKSYLQFALLPDAKWMAANYAPYLAKENWTYSYFFDDLVRSGDISHTISCELEFPTTIVNGLKSSITLDLNGGTADIKAQSAKLHKELMASRTLPKAGMNNASIEQQMVNAINNEGWNDKFQKAIITSSSWTIEKNSLTGVIVYRYLAAVCTTKSSDGKCYYQEFTFRQDYAGNGNYDSKIKFNSYGGKKEIGCDKLK